MESLEKRWRKFKKYADEGALKAEDLDQLKTELLDDIVDEMLLLQAASAAELTVSDKEIQAELTRMKADYHDDARYSEALLSAKTSPKELDQLIRERLLVKKLFAKKVHSRIAVTDKDITEYYEKHREDFALPERVEAQMIVVKTENEAKDLRSRIWRGEKFEDLAKQYSLSPEGKKGGGLGVFAKGSMPPLFDVCFTLREGAVSQPIPSEFGIHLFKVLKKHSARQRGPTEVGPEIETILLQKRRREAEEQFVKELRDRADIKINRRMLDKLT